MTDAQGQVDQQVVETPRGVPIGEILGEQGVSLTGGLSEMTTSGDGRKRKKELATAPVVEEVEIEAEVEPEAVEVTEAEAESEAEPEAEEIVEEIETAVVLPAAVEVAVEEPEVVTEAVEPDDTGKAVVVEAATRNITGFPYGGTEALTIAFQAAFELGTARMDVLRSPEKVPELGMRCLVCDRREVSQTRFVHCGHGECAPYGAVAQQVLSWVVSQSPARGEQQSNRPARPQQRRSEDEKMAVRRKEFQVVADSVRSWFGGQAPETVKIALRATFYHGGLNAHLVMELLRSEQLDRQVTASAIGVALRHRDYCVRRYGLQLFRRPSRGWSVN